MQCFCQLFLCASKAGHLKQNVEYSILGGREVTREVKGREDVGMLGMVE